MVTIIQERRRNYNSRLLNRVIFYNIFNIQDLLMDSKYIYTHALV